MKNIAKVAEATMLQEGLDTTLPTQGPFQIEYPETDNDFPPFSIFNSNHGNKGVAEVYREQDAKFIAEAFNVAHETGMGPSALAEKCKVLIALNAPDYNPDDPETTRLNVNNTVREWMQRGYRLHHRTGIDRIQKHLSQAEALNAGYAEGLAVCNSFYERMSEGDEAETLKLVMAEVRKLLPKVEKVGA